MTRILNANLDSFRLFSSGKSSGIGKTFTNSLEGTPFNIVYKNNMANDSFIKNPIELIEKTLSTPQSALFRTQSSIRASDYFQNCKVGSEIVTPKHLLEAISNKCATKWFFFLLVVRGDMVVQNNFICLCYNKRLKVQYVHAKSNL